MSRKSVQASEYRASIGREIGVSDWFVLDQARIDRFADVTEDLQFIHVSPARAAGTDFGGTIAHGFLSLSLVSAMSAQVLPVLAGQAFEINYGFNKLRFLSPVRAGRRVRGRFILADLNERRHGEVLATLNVTVEIESEARPALVAEWLVLSIAEAADPAGEVATMPHYSHSRE